MLIWPQKTFDEWWSENSNSGLMYGWSKTVWDAAIASMEGVRERAPNTGMDAIPLWAVRTWLRRNVDSNLAIVETKIVEMVGIAEQHHT